MKKLMTNKPPRGLSPEARAWWNRIVEEFNVEDQAGRLLLQTALEAFDEMRKTQKILAVDGLLILDRFNQKKPHPLIPQLRDARTAMMRALRALNLDIVPPKEEA
jgi:phage terminase small subunit